MSKNNITVIQRNFNEFSKNETSLNPYIKKYPLIKNLVNGSEGIDAVLNTSQKWHASDSSSSNFTCSIDDLDEAMEFEFNLVDKGKKLDARIVPIVRRYYNYMMKQYIENGKTYELLVLLDCGKRNSVDHKFEAFYISFLFNDKVIKKMLFFKKAITIVKVNCKAYKSFYVYD